MEISTGNGNGIKLDVYKGRYSLVSLREGNDGKLYGQWARYQTGRDKEADKPWPVKINLGDREMAIGALKMILKELDSEDVPF